MKTTDEDAPLTEKKVAKLLGIVATIVTAVISLVWFAASLKGDITTLTNNAASFRREIETRDTAQDREIERLKAHAEETDRAIGEINRKLDVSVAILERIEKRIIPINGLSPSGR